MTGAGRDVHDAHRKPVTAARLYDYYLGGIHNFPADREVGKALLERTPRLRTIARDNRAFLARAIRYLTSVGVHQFLDVGSGIPTEGNVHEIAQAAVPDARVVYVDIDPDAVSESLELLEGNQFATAIRANVREPRAVLDHPRVRNLLDFDKPIAVLMVAVLHFVEDSDEVCDILATFRSALASGSHLVVAHATIDELVVDERAWEKTQKDYRRQTSTALVPRSRSDVARFFDGFEMVEPGLVWLNTWRPEPDMVDEFRDKPEHSGFYVGVGRLS
ncbi:SAM-dependent methyltransferase [Couchioplanes caeruleus]|uniref:SAM-dependent methyltransferase n=1 Tax=Couchioplanes caeruleus TaxID=56438 RepID=UPI0020BF6FB9|nr:SAM-dependent methyltransferase [Couchioplanes caeruleus]UQU62666.1 SAM-dependent methyltransferase [Couchioplanes caeruleus]